MAQATTTRFGKFRVMLGDGGSPQEFASPCGFTSKSLALTKNLSEVNIPDCDDPDAVPWIGRDAQSLSAAISGEGVLAAESVENWLDAFENVDSVDVRIECEFPAKEIIWTGKMHVATFTIASEQGGRVTANVEMQSDGELSRTVDP